MNRTPEQQAIVDAAANTDDNLLVDALAGSGKTTTLLEVLGVLRGTSLLQAFNRSIADELRKKAAQKISFEKLMDINISTVHAHGLKAFSRSGQRAKTDSGKCSYLLKDMLSRYDSRDDIHRNMGKITRLVGNAKSAGFGLDSSFEEFPAINSEWAWMELAEHFNVEDELSGETSIEQVIELSRKLLEHSNRRLNMIDFDDMIYLPLLLNLNLPQYDNVLIDEAQDINATRRELAFRSMSSRGRIIAVGDPNQAIYGFTGADVASLDNIARRAHSTRLPLTICWRCDAAVITSAQEQVPAIQPRPNAGEGSVTTIDFEQDRFLDLPQPGDAILCRLNKPNVAVCLGLLRRGVRAKIEGRDLGKRLEQHVTKASPLYATEPLEETLASLEVYRDVEVQKLVSKNKPESAIAMLEDELEAAQLILERANESAGFGGRWHHFTTLLTDLFGDEVSKAYVTLSSVHKSKGREWQRVFILGYSDYMPHGMAKMPWERVQEQNLIYVAKTRAERSLVLVNGAKDAIDGGVHRQAPKKAEAEPRCNLGVGCEEAGTCYAEAHGKPEECGLPASMDLAMPTLDQLKEYRK